MASADSMTPFELERALLRVRAGRRAADQLAAGPAPEGAVAVFRTAVVAPGSGGKKVAAGQLRGFRLKVSLEPGTALPAGIHEVVVVGEVATTCVAGTFYIGVGVDPSTVPAATYAFAATDSSVRAGVKDAEKDRRASATEANKEHKAALKAADEDTIGDQHRAAAILAADQQLADALTAAETTFDTAVFDLFRDFTSAAPSLEAPVWADQLPRSLNLEASDDDTVRRDLGTLVARCEDAEGELVTRFNPAVHRQLKGLRASIEKRGSQYTPEDAYQDARVVLLTQMRKFASPARPNTTLLHSLGWEIPNKVRDALDRVENTQSGETGKLRRFRHARLREHNVRYASVEEFQADFEFETNVNRLCGAPRHLTRAEAVTETAAVKAAGKLPEAKFSEAAFALALSEEVSFASLDQKVGSADSTTTLADLLPAEESAALAGIEDAEALEALFDARCLTTLERLVLRERLALDEPNNVPVQPWKVVAQALGLTGKFRNESSGEDLMRQVARAATAKLAFGRNVDPALLASAEIVAERELTLARERRAADEVARAEMVTAAQAAAARKHAELATTLDQDAVLPTLKQLTGAAILALLARMSDEQAQRLDPRRPLAAIPTRDEASTAALDALLGSRYAELERQSEIEGARLERALVRGRVEGPAGVEAAVVEQVARAGEKGMAKLLHPAATSGSVPARTALPAPQTCARRAVGPQLTLLSPDALAALADEAATKTIKALKAARTAPAAASAEAAPAPRLVSIFD